MDFHVEVEAAAAPTNAETIGIDLGLTALAALSNGETIERPRLTKQAGKACDGASGPCPLQTWFQTARQAQGTVWRMSPNCLGDDGRPPRRGD
jgi:hypothetical protein